MPYGLFDYEDAMEPMGLSLPVTYDTTDPRNREYFQPKTYVNPYNPYGYSTTNPAKTGMFDPYGYSKTPQYIPNNQSITTRAIPENPPASGFGVEPPRYNTMAIPEGNEPIRNVTRAIPENGPIATMNPPQQSGIPATAQKFAYMGAENSPPQQVMTDGLIGSEAPPQQQACNPMTTRPAFGTSECGPTPNPINTMAIPESGGTPTPPSGQCPAGYTSNDAGTNIGNPNGFNSNPYGLTAGQQIVGPSTGKPFNVNQAGNTWQDITNFAPRIAYASR